MCAKVFVRCTVGLGIAGIVISWIGIAGIVISWIGISWIGTEQP